MTSTVEVENVLKTDTQGRVFLPEARKEALLDEFEKSGLSGARFAKLVGVCYSSFAQWARRRRESRGANEAAPSNRRRAGEPVRFLEAVIDEGAPRANPERLTTQASTQSGNGAPAGLTVDLPGGARLQINSPLQLQLAADLLCLMNRQQQSLR